MPFASPRPPPEALPIPAGLPPRAQEELAAAVAALDGTSFAIRLAALVGMPIEALRARLPQFAQGLIDSAVRRALDAAITAAMRSDPARTPLPVAPDWFHRGLAATTGAAGGALGLAGTLVELPVSTALLLRQIAAVAAEQGEDLADPAVAAECLKVFALGGHDPADDTAESGYFAVRLALAEALQGVVGRTLLPGFVAQIAARFTGPAALKLSAQAAPLLGAATGAAINLAFLEHFRGVARGHFTVRRLEREHGAALVQAAYTALRDARFAG